VKQMDLYSFKFCLKYAMKNICFFPVLLLECDTIAMQIPINVLHVTGYKIRLQSVADPEMLRLEGAEGGRPYRPLTFESATVCSSPLYTVSQLF